MIRGVLRFIPAETFVVVHDGGRPLERQNRELRPENAVRAFVPYFLFA